MFEILTFSYGIQNIKFFIKLNTNFDQILFL